MSYLIFFFTDSKIMIEIAILAKLSSSNRIILWWFRKTIRTPMSTLIPCLLVLPWKLYEIIYRNLKKKFENRITQLYDENFLMYFRFSKKDSYTYIRCSCRAEMKKGVCYKVDVKIEDGGSVIEAQCECAVGMGPDAHCKHVTTVMYGAVMFAKDKYIKTEETCTQRLQTFHKCKKFKGSPMKASSVDLPGADEFTKVDFDPRPMDDQNNPAYQDYFRNVCLNFQGISKMPIFQTIKPANTLAVAHDHDYLKLTPEDSFLHLSNISTITDSEIQKIKTSTKGQSISKNWLEERTKRLTSSMFGRICKCTDRTDRKKLAKSLTQIKQIKTSPIVHGQKHESIAIKRFMRDEKKNVQTSGLVVCKEYPFLAASPDGIISDEELVEVKCPYVNRNQNISLDTVPFLLESKEGGYCLDNKHDYFYQIQGQLLCTGAKWCTLVVCLADKLTVNDIKYIEVKRDDMFISTMVERLEDFYDTYFRDAILEKYFYKSYQE